MMDHINRIFSTDNFMPHGMCYLWHPGVLGLHVVSDSLIAFAYFTIPFTLLYFVRKRVDLQFNWMFVCFAIFIVACGTTHLMEIWTIWHAAYWLSGSIKAITALASVPTAILLIKLVPDALRLPSPSALQSANLALEREVAERNRAEGEVRRINEELEARVAQRTNQLVAANQRLLQEARERERAEETVRSSQLLLQAIVDNSMAVIYVKDLQGRYLLVNRRYEDIFHRRSEDVLGRTDYEFFAKGDADAYRAMDERVAAADAALTEEETVPQVDGIHTYVSVKCPLRGTAGKTYAVFGISTDITERKRAEERQRTQLERMHLLDHITRAIGERQDLHSIFQVVIRSLEDHLPIDFGCIGLYEPAREALQIVCVGVQSQAIALEPALPEQTRIDVDQNGLGRCVQGQLVYESDIAGSDHSFSARLARGGLRAVVFAPLSVESKVFAILVAARREVGSFATIDCEFLRQISEHLALAAHQSQLYSALQQAYDDLRRTQQSVMDQERLRTLGQMASGIAHDINNALAPAAVYSQTLLERDQSLSQQARSYLVVIQRAIEGVAGTVARLREFYRPRERELALVPVDLNAVLTHVAELTRVRWSDMPQQYGFVIELRAELAPMLPKVLGAENEIRDALTNLVVNAVDAMPAGGVLTLRSSWGDADADPAAAFADRAWVEVSDTGVGMTEEARRRCMEPFFTTKGEQGTGLGLAMVYGMAQRHGAEFTIESELGKGTTVHLAFPLAPTLQESPPQPLAQAATPLPLAQAATPLRVLLVDDDPLLLKSLHDILESDGHFARTAHGGQAGIDEFLAALAHAEPFAVVITDLGMPNVDGRAVASVIKAAAPATPVVLLSGWGHGLQGDKMPEYVDHVLSKPPRLADLRAVLAKIASARPTRS
jgi:PAS domain S-box-containing protein